MVAPSFTPKAIRSLEVDMRAKVRELLDNVEDRIDAVLFEKIDSLHRAVDRETELIRKGCERDIRKVDDRLRLMEKKMWTIFGALSIISFAVSIPGQAILRPFFQPSQPRLTPVATPVIIESPQMR